MEQWRDDAGELDEGDAELAEQFVNFGVSSGRRAPLYAALSQAVARRPDITRLLLHAPETQRQPVLLFACTHFLLLAEPDDPLAQWYPNLTTTYRSPDDGALGDTFAVFVEQHRSELIRLLETRSTQTNEVGRCGLFLPAFGNVAEEVGVLGHLDVGTSGGLNLLLDQFEYRYTADGETLEHVVGGPSTVVIRVSTRGEIDAPETMPKIGARLGIDRAPIDVTDPTEARWLEACVWPDQADRFHRLRSAIVLAGAAMPKILPGDAIESLADGIVSVANGGHPVVTNSWVLSYLTADQRVAYLHELDRVGSERDLSWVFIEAPALVPELPAEPDPANPHLTVLTLVRWRSGSRSSTTLATCHPHGYWIHWRR